MPYAHTTCQLPRARTGDSPQKSPASDGIPCQQTHGETTATHNELERAHQHGAGQVALVRGSSQEVTHTASRRSGPRRWLRSVEWLIAAGLHPRANTTTLVIARDLGARMNYDTGHALYCLHKIVARTGISRASVKRHIGYLRELGSLAWVQHGTRTNIRRALGLSGYAGTATIYAAVIPAAYDHALGHRIIGTGYEARAVADYRQMPETHAQATPTTTVDNTSSNPVDNSAKRSCEPPSLTSATQKGQVQMVGGVTTTAARSPKTSTPRSPTPQEQAGSKKRATILGTTVTAAGMQLGDKLARAIRHHVPWTRRATHDQLRWVCADMGEQQWTKDQAIRFAIETGHTHAAGYAWQPDHPHRLIAAALHTTNDNQLEDAAPTGADTVHAVAWKDSTAGQAAAQQAALAALFATSAPDKQPERTDEDRLRARLDWNTWPDVAHHYATDPDDALDLYGIRLCTYAVRMDSRQEVQA